MSLNIKDPNINNAASQLAALTGMNMTKSVMAAIYEKIERETQKRMNDKASKSAEIERQKNEILELVRSFNTAPPPGMEPLSTANMDDGMYDEDGLPI